MRTKLILFLILAALTAGGTLYARNSNPARNIPVTPSSTKPGTATKPASPASQGVTGTITTGSPVSVATTSISISGGTVAVADPNSPLDGMEIKVPANAYGSATQFTVSSAPVEKHTFGEMFNPISPLITVENGGEYSQEIMEVTVPVRIPEGHFAMGFLYDTKTRRLEGLPLIAQDADSITVATQHFSSLIFSSIDMVLLSKDIDSGFKPGIDDWQFANVGSHIEPGGHCSGQSMTAMWYYIERPDGKDTTLWGRYDNNGEQPATPRFWRDDSLGYRFSSVVQKDHDWESRSVRIFSILSRLPEETVRLFAYSMLVTGEPQLAGVYNTTAGGGHALVVYRISDGNLYVADPNYPGMALRRIEYSNGKFTPYSSVANAEEIAKGTKKDYDRITYFAKTALVDWDKIGERWKEVKNRTIGDDYFPSYEIVRIDDSDEVRKLEDGYASPNRLLNLSMKTNTADNLEFFVYRDGKLLQADTTTFAEGAGFALNPGNNLLGIYVNGIDAQNKGHYVDFKYFNVVYGATVTPPGGVWTLTETLVFQKAGEAEGYSVTPGSITRISSITGIDNNQYELTAAFNFEKPPATVRPGERINLKASGTVSSSLGARPMTPNISAGVFYKAGTGSQHDVFHFVDGKRVSG